MARHFIERVAIGLALPASVIASPSPAAPISLVAAVSAVDRNFTCPEFLPDDAARQADLAAFGQAMAAVGPRRLTLADATNIRIKLLERHHCYDSLSAMGQAGPIHVQPASQEAVAGQ